ncbi:S-adenosyl-l-methionine hydroxide adenosyltransferase family protein [Listeria weihenstephanensis]|uniref:S-adenosyl-l-methionine hydroxide adenosyltransferase family protein n=1 Tax=Listeria weihenstephanensis TaxID=1006155 RepID=A0A841Z5H0_9LIST|nr:S-adenosyl-l-methionine hydroxide adenosyltransferase family protein [Listeria weihenstephanensis]MBC1499717.1 S-adenosyl-l-methionine hydroxide adenosyltransferase family protein [Listeria weihenstephanensis]
MTQPLLVLQSDFGISDGAVSAMYGVINTVSTDIRIYDLTHQIPQYNIWEGSYRLLQTVNYWPENTIFVSIVDPGVGSDRRSVAIKTETGQYIITPDNGTLTHLKNYTTITDVRIIDEQKNRLPKSGESHTFHGRDIFAYTAARLAAGIIDFQDIGPAANPDSIVELPLVRSFEKDGELTGTIDIIDRPFGNLWTNIERTQFIKIGAKYGDSFELTIESNTRQIYQNFVTYGRSFADLRVGDALIYVNSLDNLGIGINQGSFVDAYKIGIGTNWIVTIKKK